MAHFVDAVWVNGTMHQCISVICHMEECKQWLKIVVTQVCVGIYLVSEKVIFKAVPCHYQIGHESIEKVQERALRISHPKLPYKVALQETGIPTLESRWTELLLKESTTKCYY